MKRVHRNIIMFLVCCGVILITSQAFCAATGFEDDAGGPQGLAIQGDAPGEKLAGLAVLEFYNIETFSDGSRTADCRAVVRLRKAQTLKTFYAEAEDRVSLEDPAEVQMAIMAVLADQIKEFFFNDDQTVQLVLRTAEEFGNVDYESVYFGVGFYSLADIVIAGK